MCAEINRAVGSNVDNRAASLRAELFDADIGEVINAVRICEVDALIVYGEIIQMVVSAENRIRAAELLHFFKETVFVDSRVNYFTRFARRAVVELYIFRVFKAVGGIFRPCVFIFRKRNVKKNWQR